MVILFALLAALVPAHDTTTSGLTVSLGAGKRRASLPVVAAKPAAFKVRLVVPKAAHVTLSLTGVHAPKGGPLIDTATFGCTVAGALRTCTASYEALPAGRYTWVVRKLSAAPAAVKLRVRY